MAFIHKFYSSLVPKSLLARFALIICVPMIICQLLAVYLFYERHWYNVTIQTSKMLISQIELIGKEYSEGDLTKVVKYSQRFGFTFEIVPELPKIQKAQKNEIIILGKVLKKSLHNFLSVSHNRAESKIRIYLELENGELLKITIPAKPLFNPTSEIFVFWIIGTSIIFLAVAMIFAKNQIRSIEELSAAADSFGKGGFAKPDFKPTGAIEIRQAGIAFIKMRERIEKQVKKRTQMLAMISHDLRTPLTRMLLQLELLDKTSEHNLLLSDVESMKHMIDSYLDFARGEEAETAEFLEINTWLKEFFSHSRFKSTKLILTDNKLYAFIKPLAFMRAISNLVSNAEKYASYSELSCEANDNNIVITLEDNGPGIKEEEKHMVFQAFYRSDKARRIDQHGSVGLGLPIAKEIILSHKGGIVILDSKKLGGARILVTIPKQTNIGKV